MMHTHMRPHCPRHCVSMPAYAMHGRTDGLTDKHLTLGEKSSAWSRARSRTAIFVDFLALRAAKRRAP